MSIGISPVEMDGFGASPGQREVLDFGRGMSVKTGEFLVGSMFQFDAGDPVLKKNVLWWDRVVRFFLGSFMVAWAIAGGPVWAYLGLYFLASGSWGFCGIYSLLNYQPFGED